MQEDFRLSQMEEVDSHREEEDMVDLVLGEDALMAEDKEECRRDQHSLLDVE